MLLPPTGQLDSTVQRAVDENFEIFMSGDSATSAARPVFPVFPDRFPNNNDAAPDIPEEPLWPGPGAPLPAAAANMAQSNDIAAFAALPQIPGSSNIPFGPDVMHALDPFQWPNGESLTDHHHQGDASVPTDGLPKIPSHPGSSDADDEFLSMINPEYYGADDFSHGSV